MFGTMDKERSLILAVSIPLTALLCFFMGWRNQEYVPRQAGWPPARREISRLFLKLLDRPKVSYQNLSEKERILWDVCRFAACFENTCLVGGLEHFFWNEPGNHALATVDALEKIGAKHTAAFMRQACAFFPDGEPSSDQKMRREQMERISGMMLWASDHPAYQETCLRLFFGIGDNLFAHLLKYWNEHPS